MRISLSEVLTWALWLSGSPWDTQQQPPQDTAQRNACTAQRAQRAPHAQRDVELHGPVLQEHVAVARQPHLGPRVPLRRRQRAQHGGRGGRHGDGGGKGGQGGLGVGRRAQRAQREVAHEGDLLVGDEAGEVRLRGWRYSPQPMVFAGGNPSPKQCWPRCPAAAAAAAARGVGYCGSPTTHPPPLRTSSIVSCLKRTVSPGGGPAPSSRARSSRWSRGRQSRRARGRPP